MTSEQCFDISTFHRQVLPQREKMYRCSLRMLRSAQDAEDMVQEAFLRLWKIQGTPFINSLKRLTTVWPPLMQS